MVMAIEMMSGFQIGFARNFVRLPMYLFQYSDVSMNAPHPLTTVVNNVFRGNTFNTATASAVYSKPKPITVHLLFLSVRLEDSKTAPKITVKNTEKPHMAAGV